MNRIIFRTIALIAVVVALAGVALAQYMPQPPYNNSLTINVAASRHSISPDIYGLNDYSASQSTWGSGATALPITLQNWGGDATEAYNWSIDSSNSGDDNYFIGGGNTSPTPGKSVDTWISFMEAKGFKSSTTVPISGFVNGLEATNCSYPQAWYNNQQAYSGVKDASTNSACGDGLYGTGPNAGTNIPDTNVLYNYISVTPAWMQAWYNHIYTKYGPSFNAQGGVTPGSNSGNIWVFDNEPEYWGALHADSHPNPPGWAELANGPLEYGVAAKNVDPTTLTGGPTVSSIWPLWDPGAVGNDGVAQPYGFENPTAATCTINGVSGIACPFYEYYLTSAANYQAATGVRPLDYFIVHYYPDSTGGGYTFGGPAYPNCNPNVQCGLPPADGVYYNSASYANTAEPYYAEGYGSAAGGTGGTAARLRLTRSLWDPTYITEDWEGFYFPTTYGNIQLIRNMKNWINQYYPGTKTGITEYGWGGSSINAILTLTDVLGIYGREGLDMATIWGSYNSTVWKLFLNYNGTSNGTGQFGNISVSSNSTVRANSILPGTGSTDGQYVLAVYGAQRTLDNALTLMIVNKSLVLSAYPYSSSGAIAFNSVPINIQNFTPNGTTVTAYQVTSSSIASAASATLVQVPATPGSGQLPTYTTTYNFPANSVTLLVIPGAAVQGQAISFAAPSSPVTYGVAPITLSATGGPSGNPVTFSVLSGPGTIPSGSNILTVTGVGTIVVAANQTGNSGYSAAAQVTQSIVVNKAPLTVTANNTIRAVRAANPAFTASYSGFVNGEGAGVLSGSPSLTTTATSSSPAGTYPITAAVGSLTAANYSFSFVNGTLSIVAAPTVVITTSAVLSGSAANGYTATIKVTNSGTGAASNVVLSTATLGSATGSPLPQNVASIPAGGFTTFSVSFAGSAGADGAGVKETYSGTYTGGSFSASVRSVTLP